MRQVEIFSRGIIEMSNARVWQHQVVCVADARLPDCPIVFANQRFFDLTQYTREEILGRNCRFLQGPDTDRDDVTEIREAIKAGRPVSSCILNYKKDGTLFWNHLHIEPVCSAFSHQLDSKSP
ncbi:hypothetical protein GUITHDRAFT_71576 [Guillardia theta CCMP2712]|uniref:PAS domain-containing protein n=1 Tax=Guillardia theta (strain CCMP2712) TaxID=905079 RepID=L1JB19_GUITC|nr:hypothetical protein GUITHDRAFT_71576 [Guillardia theta CCMP2712]EKX45289.1 hypothetical protein GUITHDRAFT_71576 [Guillardia theta CCMP2712]|eukprot:XP_005832269.1 hypothetical protein GUITHDRAFT_71576 [Guillardia theta CCMP2712]